MRGELVVDCVLLAPLIPGPCLERLALRFGQEKYRVLRESGCVGYGGVAEYLGYLHPHHRLGVAAKEDLALALHQLAGLIG
jgi:hypothetical protein